MEADIVVSLESPAHLFVAPEPGPSFESAGLESGIDQLINQVRSRSLSRAGGATILVAGSQLDAGTGDAMKAGIVRYCDRKLGEAVNDRRAVEREGLGALVIGATGFTVALLLSWWINRSSAGPDLRFFLSDGFFLIAAWIAIWYPVDTLVYTRRSYRRTEKVLTTLRHMDITVRPSDDP